MTGTERRFLVLILAVGLLHGLLYVALVPPWQHYDEPTHFEYVRLIAERGRLPRPGDYDLALRREIASSMREFGFWSDKAAGAIDLESDTPPNIGISELYHPPLYYALLALPQRLVMGHSVETQLYVARLCSVLLYLVVLAAAQGVVSEAAPGRKWLPLVVTSFLALLPPFVDVMSAVNNDAGAAAATSLFLWASVRLARRGPSLLRILATLLLAGTCLAVKSTAGVVAAAVGMWLGVGLLPRRYRRWLGPALAVLMAAAAAATLTWQGQAAYWTGDNPAGALSRRAAGGPVGDAALVLSATDDRYGRTVFQELLWRDGLGLRGHTVTLGAWLRTPKGADGFAALALYDGQDYSWQRAPATPEWQFHAFTTTLDVEARAFAVYAILPEREGAATEVLVDGLILVDGEMPLDQVPRFDSGRSGRAWWGDRQVKNLLRNGSAEVRWPGLRSWIGRLTVSQEPVARIWQSVLDWRRTGWVYRVELSNLVKSFWGSFGWSHLTLPAPYFYLLGSISACGVLGCVRRVVSRRRSGEKPEPPQVRAWGVLAVAVLAGWGMTILRVHPVFLTRHLYVPVARYADVVIVASAALLCAGLGWIVPRRYAGAAAWAGLLGLLVLDAVAVWTVTLPYYY